MKPIQLTTCLLPSSLAWWDSSIQLLYQQWLTLHQVDGSLMEVLSVIISQSWLPFVLPILSYTFSISVSSSKNWSNGTTNVKVKHACWLKQRPMKYGKGQTLILLTSLLMFRTWWWLQFSSTQCFLCQFPLELLVSSFTTGPIRLSLSREIECPIRHPVWLLSSMVILYLTLPCFGLSIQSLFSEDYTAMYFILKT